MKTKPLPRPRQSIITALELIGLDDPSMPEGRARAALTLVQEYLGDDADLRKHYESQLSLTGHHALYVAPIKPEGMLPFRVALKLVHLQSGLFPLGVLVRGAITLGNGAAQAGLVIGQGVADAERLRDEVAGVPRVIMDPRLLREIEQNPALRAQHHDPMDELGYMRDLLRQDADGLWFVDYLWASHTECGELSDYFQFFRDHRRLVLRRLEAASELDRSARTVTWLWRYHDQVFDLVEKNWRLDPEHLDDLRLPAQSPLVYRFPPSAKAP